MHKKVENHDDPKVKPCIKGKAITTIRNRTHKGDSRILSLRRFLPLIHLDRGKSLCMNMRTACTKVLCRLEK